MEVIVNNNTIEIKKSGTWRWLSVATTIIIFLVFIVIICINLFSNDKIKSMDFSDFGVLLLILSITLFALIYNINRDRRKYSKLFFEIRNQEIYLNQARLCKGNEIYFILISEVTDGDGASSYNIDLNYENGRIEIAFDLSKNEAMLYSNSIASFFNVKIKKEEKDMVMP